MQEIFLKSLIDAFFIVLALNAALYYTYFWQLKEYRLDRMKDFLRTTTGRKRLLNWLLIIKLLLIVVLLITYATYVLTDTLSEGAVFNFSLRFWQYYVPFVLLVAIAELIELGVRIIKHRLYRPDFTPKALLIILLTCSVAVFFPFQHFQTSWSWRELLIVWSVVYLFLPICVDLIVVIFMPITRVSKAFVLTRARKKMRDHRELIVVAITGSYGKSSTKEFLNHFLSSKYKVVTTPGNTNTEIGIARVVLKLLKPEHEVFVVEAGAYVRGEIRKIADIVKPKIAIITAVKDSHLSLFGSLENIKRGKFELVESLPKTGVAVFNLDNEGSADLATRAMKRQLGKIITFSMRDDGATLEATDIKENINGVTFTVRNVSFELSVPGKHNVSNFLGAVAVGLELGLTLEEMANIAKQVRLRDHTLTVLKPSDDLIILDDTYNANPDGVVAALDYLNLYTDKQKIIVFPGMQELGERSRAEHARVAKKIMEVCDYAFINSSDFKSVICSVFDNHDFEKYEVIEGNQRKLLSEIKMRVHGKSTVILFISRGSEHVLNSLKNASENN